MFPNPHCSLERTIQRPNQQSEDYIQKLVLDEERRAKESDGLNHNTSHQNDQQISSAICKELREYKKQDFLEEKRRQHLRANSHELRLLEAQLRTALMTKELREQNDALRKEREERIREKREEDAQLSSECEKLRRLVMEQEEVENKQKIEFRAVLQDQINELQRKRRSEIEAAIKDREEMQKTLKHLKVEKDAELFKAHCFRERCRQEMEDNLRTREIRRKIEKEQAIDEDERLLSYQSDKYEVQNQIEAEKKQLLMKKMALSEKIGQELAAVSKEKQKREDLLINLLVEERKAKEDDRYRQCLDKQIKERRQLREEIENYRKELLIQKERQLKEDERQIREENLRQMAERDKIDQMSDEKRRRKTIEHNRALKEMIDIRRRQRAEEIAERIKEFEKLLKNEKQRDEFIEEERIQILRATPGELLRYLPAGVLKPSDREFLALGDQRE